MSTNNNTNSTSMQEQMPETNGSSGGSSSSSTSSSSSASSPDSSDGELLEQEEGSGRRVLLYCGLLFALGLFVAVVIGILVNKTDPMTDRTTGAKNNAAGEEKGSSVSGSSGLTPGGTKSVTSSKNGGKQTEADTNNIMNTKRAGQVSMLAGGAGMVVASLGMGASKLLMDDDGESSGTPKKLQEGESSDSSIVKNSNGDSSSLLRKSSGQSGVVDESWSKGTRGVVLTPDNWDSVMADETDNMWVIWVSSEPLEKVDCATCPDKQQFWNPGGTLSRLVKRYQDPDSEDYNPRVKFGVFDAASHIVPKRIHLQPGVPFNKHFQFLAAGTSKAGSHRGDANDDELRLDSLIEADKSRYRTSFEDMSSRIDQLSGALPSEPGSSSSSTITDSTNNSGGNNTDDSDVGSSGCLTQSCAFSVCLVFFFLSLVVFLGGLLLICADKFQNREEHGEEMA